MTVTLERLLQDAELGLRLIVGPAHGCPDDIEIDWAHGIELVDPRRFLRGGEMVMLTGLRLSRRRADQVAYVDRLVEVPVAALGFGIGVQFDAVPEAVVARCRDVGLPLVEIPLRTPFMAISQEIARQESVRRTAPLHDLIDLQQTLSRATVRGGIPGLIRRAHHTLGALAVLDDDGIVLSSAAPDWFLAQMTAFVRSHRSRSAAGTIVLTPQQESNRAPSDCALIEVHALTGRHVRRGWLAMGPSHEPRPTDRLLINQIVSLVTLSLDADRRLVDDRLEPSALAALLRRDPADPEVLDMVALYGFPVDGDAVLLCLPGAAEGTVGELHRDLAAAGIDHLCRGDGAEALVLVRTDDSEHAIRLIQGRLDGTGAAPTPIGVSAALPMAHIARGLEPARRSAASAARRRQPVARADELSIESLMADPLLREHVRDRTGPVFAALDTPATPRDGDLAEALRVFLRHNGKWGSAAAELGVHRHTLYSRISRIEQLTGIDLDDAHQRALLLLAWAAREEQ